MDITLSFVLICLALMSIAAAGLGLLIHRVHVRRAGTADSEEPLGYAGMDGAVSFIGGAAAFLLGVLMLASLDHYNATKAVVGEEALAFDAAFTSTEGLGAKDQGIIQRDLICLMGSVATNSWAAAEAGDFRGSDETHAWRRRASDHANAVDPKTKAQENSLAALQSELINASKSGQERLLTAQSDLPLALWILVFVSVFALISSLTALLRSHPNRILAVSSLAAVLLLTTAMMWTLTTFGEPFNKSDGVYIPPRALNATLVRLQNSYPGADWSPCGTLAKS